MDGGVFFIKMDNTSVQERDSMYHHRQGHTVSWELLRGRHTKETEME